MNQTELKLAQLEARIARIERGEALTKTYSLAALPKATSPGQVIRVHDAAAGEVLAMADGTNWLEFQPVGVIS